MTRQRQALGNPPGSPSGLSGFPRWPLKPDRDMFRAHSTSNGPWWFASAHGTRGDSRFDLPAPFGTCYLASTESGAIRERWGRNLVQRGYVMAVDADTTSVSILRVPTSHRLADTCNAKAANYGITRELGSMTPYALPQAWAAAFHDLGCAGIRYEPRFSTGPRDLAYAVFGDAGPAAWPEDPAPASGRTAAARAGITVLEVPRTVRISRPISRGRATSS